MGRCNNALQASALLTEMGDKYKQLEASMQENAEVCRMQLICAVYACIHMRQNWECQHVAWHTQSFKQMMGEGTKQAQHMKKVESLLTSREREVQQLKVDVANANTKLIKVSAENLTLRNQVGTLWQANLQQWALPFIMHAWIDNGAKSGFLCAG